MNILRLGGSGVCGFFLCVMVTSNIAPIIYRCMAAFSSRASIISMDGAVVTCWHPCKEIPYEKTKPIVRDLDALRCPESPLKVQFTRNSMPTVQEVAQSLCKSPRSLKPRRTERSFSPYYWDNAILRKRL